jgi:hypothetical protein
MLKYLIFTFVRISKAELVWTFGGSAGGKQCTFPFEANSKNYTECTTDTFDYNIISRQSKEAQSREGTPWCRTIDDTFGFCLSKVSNTDSVWAKTSRCNNKNFYKIFLKFNSWKHRKKSSAEAP